MTVRHGKRRTRRRLLAKAFVATCAAFAAATLSATTAVAADVPSARLIHAGRLLDHPGKPARGASTLVVRDGRIEAVHEGLRTAASLALPADTPVVDLSSKFVLPGLIDSHVHLDSDLGGVAGLVEGMTRSPPAAAFDALVNARETLRAGFTTVRNLGDGDGANFLAFLKKAVRKHAGKEIHIVLDNLSTHTTPEVQEWLSANPNVHFHFTPKGASWINQIETWFGIITRQSIRRGTFSSVKTLIKQIRDYIAHWNTNPKPFIWTATADEILAKVRIVQTNIKKLVDNNAK